MSAAAGLAGALPRAAPEARRPKPGASLVSLLVTALLLGSTGARAEAPWLTSRGRLLPAVRLEVFGGPGSVGVGVVRPDADDASAGLGLELAWALMDRTAELRAARVWQLTRTGTATVSAALGTSLFVVPVPGFDAGGGANVGLTLSLGGARFTFDVGLSTAMELFLRLDTPRLPQRVLVGLNLTLDRVSVSVMARAGVDVMPGHAFVGRAEAVLSLGWLVAR